MASIQISNLYPAGSELFKDSENFMTELVDSELGNINGGIGIIYNSPRCHPTIFSPWCKPSLPRPITTTLPPKI
jgi:hypothetical protein